MGKTIEREGEGGQRAVDGWKVVNRETGSGPDEFP